MDPQSLSKVGAAGATMAALAEDPSTEASAPLVTALIVTHDHARYIGTAIESALAQETRFAVEILISEDASIDGTREIVARYAEAHPDRIRLLLSRHNLRSNAVVARGLRAARGRYIAMLDGDDQWCDVHKLQRQADFLESDPDCAAVFGNALLARGDHVTRERWTRPETAPRLGLATLMEGNPFATCAGMMRTDCVRSVPTWYDDFFPITDWPLYTLCAEKGELAFVDEAVGVYRLHDGGSFSARSRREKLDAVEGFYRRLARHAPAQVARAAKGGCARYFFDWAKAHLANGELAHARSCFRRSLFCGGIGQAVAPRETLRLGLRLARSSLVQR